MKNFSAHEQGGGAMARASACRGNHPHASVARRAVRPCRGFSLIELLVCIVVIAILASVVSGVVGNMRERSRDMRCVFKLRNLHAMMIFYAMEHNDYLPSVRGNNATPELPQGESWMMTVQDFNGYKFPKANTDSYAECPTARYTFPGGLARRTYAMNHAGTGDSRTAVRIQEMRLPSQTIMLADGAFNAADGSGDSYTSVGISDYARNLDWRHGEGLHALFYDGHVENIPRSDTEKLERSLLNYMQRAN